MLNKISDSDSDSEQNSSLKVCRFVLECAVVC